MIKEIIEAWNADADSHNRWDMLSEEEKIEFAYKLGQQSEREKAMVIIEQVIEQAKRGLED